jgi:hypothetical protein
MFITNFIEGISISGNKSSIQTCTAGLGPDGKSASNIDNGILVSGNNNVIGGAPATLGCILSGNAGNGISIQGASNILLNNFIGTDPTGKNLAGNHANGILDALFAVLGRLGGARPA